MRQHRTCKERNRIGDIMVVVLDYISIDREFDPRSSQTKHCEVGICCFSAKQAALSRLGIRIMCPGGATCLPAYSCFSELAQYKSACWSRTKRTIGIECKHTGYCMSNKLRKTN